MDPFASSHAISNGDSNWTDSWIYSTQLTKRILLCTPIYDTWKQILLVVRAEMSHHMVFAAKCLSTARIRTWKWFLTQIIQLQLPPSCAYEDAEYTLHVFETLSHSIHNDMQSSPRCSISQSPPSLNPSLYCPPFFFVQVCRHICKSVGSQTRWEEEICH